jgi:NADH-quinone oxidoreductase subunit H
VLSDSNLGVLIIFSISALSIYGIILAGWASNSKYAFLGALRSAAQMISYEVCISVILIIVLFCANSFNLTEIVLIQQNNWFLVPLFPIFVVFLISMLAETNRVPFDLPEAEAEIVAGYNVEYSAIPFALFFLGEYSNMLIMSALTVIFFLGGWFVPFSTSSGSSVFILKLLVVAFFFI